MRNGRLTLDEFKDEFLVQYAILSEGDTALVFDANAVAQHCKGRFPSDWVEPIERELRAGRLLVTDGFENTSRLTIDGLRRAEEICRDRGEDLWTLMDDHSDADVHQSAEVPKDPDPQAAFVPDREHIMSRDEMGDLFADLQQQVQEAARFARRNNGYVNDPETGKHIVELEAGAKLLEAQRVDVTLFKRLVVPGLTWITTIAAPETVKQVVKLTLEQIAKLVLPG